MLRASTWAIGFSVVSCGPTIDELRPQAAFDLNCPKDQIQTVELSEGVVGVTGCGQRATYVRTGNGPAANWAMSSGPGARNSGGPP
jgi:hypothetical protein